MARKKKAESASQEEAEKMVESGDASIPAEAVVEQPSAEKSSQFEKDFANHPKFSKFKGKEG